jgi:hypothetical protein
LQRGAAIIELTAKHWFADGVATSDSGLKTHALPAPV